MIKMQPVKGADPKEFGAKRPVMTCDAPGCNTKFQGSPGMGEEPFLNRATSMGWSVNPKDNSQHYCPPHTGANQAAAMGKTAPATTPMKGKK